MPENGTMMCPYCDKPMQEKENAYMVFECKPYNKAFDVSMVA
jgi:hypothetical protein